MSRIDFNFKLSDLDKFFVIINFLDDREGLTSKLQPKIQSYLDQAKHLKTHLQRKAHQQYFTEYVLSLLKEEIQDHFHLTPEEILLLTEETFIDMLTDGYYFDPDNYLNKEGK